MECMQGMSRVELLHYPPQGLELAQALSLLGVECHGHRENQEVCPSNLEADGRRHIKIHKPAQTLLGVEGQGPVKIMKPAPAICRLKASVT